MNAKILHIPELDSTNRYWKEHAFEAEDFSFLYCDYQTGGRGRNGRNWLSPKGENLLFSFVIKDKEFLQKGAKLSLYAAAAIVTYLERKGFQKITIKWPNDVYIGGRKVAGILLEGSLPNFVVVGIGLNVNQETFEGQYRVPPTSLSLICKKKIPIDGLVKYLFPYIDDFFHQTSDEEALKIYEAHDYLKGRRIRFPYNGPMKEAVVLGITKDFRLLVETLQGQVIELTSGEMTTIRYD